MNCSHSDTYLAGDGRRRCFDCREFLPDPEAVKPVMAAEPVPVAPTVISAQPSPILLNTVTQGDCLDLLPRVASGSVDMVLCDLPYGTTQNKWDSVIPFEPLWAQYARVLKPDCAIVLTCSQPFTAALLLSNPKWFRYELIWKKTCPTGFLDAKRKPLKEHENVLIFGPKTPRYYPQGLQPFGKMSGGRNTQSANWNKMNPKGITEFTGYPRSILEYGTDRPVLHPTQKPVALWEYLIRTYTNEGDTVLDNCCGSGTTGVACLNTGRNFIQMELSPEYCEIARSRLKPIEDMERKAA